MITISQKTECFPDKSQFDVAKITNYVINVIASHMTVSYICMPLNSINGRGIQIYYYHNLFIDISKCWKGKHAKRDIAVDCN